MSTASFHDRIERNIGLLMVLVILVISVGGLVEIVPLFFQKSTTQPVSGVKPYTALQLEGRDIYIREGCGNCHSQMIRPFRAETERYGHYSVAGEFVYDHPFLWGSKRTGPDLARVGLRYSDEWHRLHLTNPHIALAARALHFRRRTVHVERHLFRHAVNGQIPGDLQLAVDLRPLGGAEGHGGVLGDVEDLGGVVARGQVSRRVEPRTVAAGVRRIDVKTLDPDFLIFPTYKWVLGPYGRAFMYVARRWQNGVPLEQTAAARKQVSAEDTIYFRDTSYREDARRYDMGERDHFISLEMAAIGMEMMAGWGNDAIVERLSMLTGRLADGLGNLGVRLLDPKLRAPHIVFEIRISTVNHNVARLKKVRQRFNGLFRDLASRQHDPYRARLRHLADQIFQVGAGFSPFLAKLCNCVGICIIDKTFVSVTHQPPDNIAAHAAQTNHTKLHCQTPFIKSYAGSCLNGAEETLQKKPICSMTNN